MCGPEMVPYSGISWMGSSRPARIPGTIEKLACCDSVSCNTRAKGGSLTTDALPPSEQPMEGRPH